MGDPGPSARAHTKRLAGLLVASALALVVTSTALAGNGGVAPPPPHSPNAARITDSYWLILAIAGAIFVLVEGALVYFVVRYRNRGRSRASEGPQVRGHTRLELIWTVIPVLILAAIASFVFYKLPGIENVPKAKAAGDQVRITVEAHQFYWQFEYPNGAVSIDELHAPVNQVVRLRIVSRDVDHSWWIPELHGKFDAIAGVTNETWFKADRTGTYRGQCGEFCGIFHAQMNARVLVTSRGEFERWVGTKARAELGRSEWEGACAKCHGLTGKGDFGPEIRANPTLTDRRQLNELVRHGQGRMPPVGAGWSDEQLRALLAYVKKNVAKQGQAGATGGG